MVEVLPRDEHNEFLVANVHPSDWTNPTPDGRYNLVVIGAGTAGLVSVIGGAGLGGKVALVERHLMGGDCLNVGCVPSKALIRAARAAYQIQTATDYGYRIENAGDVDFAGVMKRMRRLRASISPHDSAKRFTEQGVDVYLGNATFLSPNSVEVAGETLEFTKCVIATGGRAAAPPIEGLAETSYLTNETIFSLTELPRRMVIIGGGPIGCEMAQAFRRFGSEVHLIDRAGHIMIKEDTGAAAIVQQQFEKEGIHLHLSCDTKRVTEEGGVKKIVVESGGFENALQADEVLVAVGRAPNIERLNLEAAGVEYNKFGVVANDRLQTTNKNVFAAGDVCTRYKFTHAADAMARIVLRNALFPMGRMKMSNLVIPRTTYTDPEVAAVGMTEQEARESGIEIDVYRQELKGVDRAILDGEDERFAEVRCRKGSGEIVGATVVAAHAGEMIGEITLLMTQRLGLGKLASVIHCYPTQVEVLKRIADSYMRTKLTPKVAGMFRWWLKRSQ